jgi:hypothetical protein
VHLQRRFREALGGSLERDLEGTGVGEEGIHPIFAVGGLKTSGASWKDTGVGQKFARGRKMEGGVTYGRAPAEPHRYVVLRSRSFAFARKPTIEHASELCRGGACRTRQGSKVGR